MAQEFSFDNFFTLSDVLKLKTKMFLKNPTYWVCGVLVFGFFCFLTYFGILKNLKLDSVNSLIVIVAISAVAVVIFSILSYFFVIIHASLQYKRVFLRKETVYINQTGILISGEIAKTQIDWGKIANLREEGNFIFLDFRDKKGLLPFVKRVFTDPKNNTDLISYCKEMIQQQHPLER